MLTAARVLCSFHPSPPSCCHPAVGIVLELRAGGHEVVGLSGPSVAATLAALGVELRTDEMPPSPTTPSVTPAAQGLGLARETFSTATM